MSCFFRRKFEKCPKNSCLRALKIFLSCQKILKSWGKHSYTEIFKRLESLKNVQKIHMGWYWTAEIFEKLSKTLKKFWKINFDAQIWLLVADQDFANFGSKKIFCKYYEVEFLKNLDFWNDLKILKKFGEIHFDSEIFKSPGSLKTLKNS